MVARRFGERVDALLGYHLPFAVPEWFPDKRFDAVGAGHDGRRRNCLLDLPVPLATLFAPSYSGEAADTARGCAGADDARHHLKDMARAAHFVGAKHRRARLCGECSRR